MPLGFVHRVKRDLKHQRFFDFAHGAKACDRVIADKAVQPFQFRIAEPGIGLAHGQQGAVGGPAAKGIIRIIRRAFPATALRIHHHAIGNERFAFPFVPVANLTARQIRRIAPLQHDALNRRLTRTGAHFRQMVKVARFDNRGQVEPDRIEPSGEQLKPVPPRAPRLAAHILRPVEQYVVQAHKHRIFRLHRRGHILTAQALLQRVEACRLPALHIAAHQQFAIDHADAVEGGGDFRERCRYFIATPAEQPRFAAR